MTRSRHGYTCADCRTDVHHLREFAYMVTDRVWQSALRKHKRLGGKASSYDLLCVGCLERRLGRRIDWNDFNWEIPLNFTPDHRRSPRLIARMGRRNLQHHQAVSWPNHIREMQALAQQRDRRPSL